MNVLIEIVLFYLLYRFIVGFLVPLYKTTTTMRQQFRDMNGRTQAGGPATNPPKSETGPNNPSPNPGSGAEKVGEYIDFEEVK